MKRRSWLVLPALLAFVVPSVFAGHDGKKCDMSTDDCLNMMATDIKAKGWVGLELDKSDAGVLTVKKVEPGSPAEKGGIQVGDVLVALNGIRFGDEKNKEALYAAKKTMKVGSQVTYTISRGGAEKKVAMNLAAVPEEVMAQWIGHHMLEHTQTAIAKN